MPTISMHENLDEHFGEILKVPAVAAYAGVHENTVWSWIKTGKIPAVRLGARIVRIRKLDLDAFIESHLTLPVTGWLSVSDERGRQ